METIIKVSELKKTFWADNSAINALQGVDLEIGQGELVVILGPSACGKTTLLSLLAGLDKPTAGTVLIEGTDLYELSSKEMARYRRTRVGIVFQQSNLVPSLSVRDNVSLPLVLSGIGKHEAHRRAEELLRLVDIADRSRHKPTALSGGEQQRVALARALATDPDILLADEPTGSLDEGNANEIVKLLRRINESGKTVIFVTHNPNFQVFGDRVIHMKEGKVVWQTDNHWKGDSSIKKLKSYSLPDKKHGLSFFSALRLTKIQCFSNKSRTFFSSLGVALGLGTIVVLVSFGAGLKELLLHQIGEGALGESSIARLTAQTNSMFLVGEIIIGAIGSVGLIVALIGILNVMIISLLERTHEIGVIKAIGATNSDVRLLFQLEVFIFGLLGGSAGVLSAWFFGSGVNVFANYLLRLFGISKTIILFITPLPFALSMLILTVFLSVLSGWYPARRAAKLYPAEALRYE